MIMCLLAAAFLFMLNRFGGIELRTEPASVRFFQGDKKGEVTTYEVRLMTSTPGVFLSDTGVEFWLEELPIRVVHDKNRGINSGNYKLRIINADDEVTRRLPHLAEFAESELDMTYYGEKEQPE
jgi:hypothetical protein